MCAKYIENNTYICIKRFFVQLMRNYCETRIQHYNKLQHHAKRKEAFEVRIIRSLYVMYRHYIRYNNVPKAIPLYSSYTHSHYAYTPKAHIVLYQQPWLNEYIDVYNLLDHKSVQKN